MLFWKTMPMAHRILLVLGAGFLVNMVLGGLPASYTALNADAILDRYEIWRLLTYPIFSTGFWPMLSASMLLYFFGPEVEHLLRPERFVRYSLLFVLVHGLLFTLLMQNSPAVFAGPTAYALAVLAVFAYMYPHAEFSLLGIITMRAWVFALIFAAFAILPGAVEAITGQRPVGVFLSGNVAGIVLGLAFAQFYFGKYRLPSFGSAHKSRSRSAVAQPSRPVTPVIKKTRTEYSPSKGKSMQSQPVYSGNSDTTPDEQRLNDILDKISEQGRSSLSDEEEQFLAEYAKRL